MESEIFAVDCAVPEGFHRGECNLCVFTGYSRDGLFVLEKFSDAAASQYGILRRSAVVQFEIVIKIYPISRPIGASTTGEALLREIYSRQIIFNGQFPLISLRTGFRRKIVILGYYGTYLPTEIGLYGEKPSGRNEHTSFTDNLNEDKRFLQ